MTGSVAKQVDLVASDLVAMANALQERNVNQSRAGIDGFVRVLLLEVVLVKEVHFQTVNVVSRQIRVFLRHRLIGSYANHGR